MNFLDALKSGKRFRRKGEKNWNDNKLFHDFMTEDWEVEENAVTITESEFDKKAAWILVGWEYNETDDAHGAVRCALEDLKKELGL